VTPFDYFLKWITALACGYEVVAIVGKALDEDFPIQTITSLTHSRRHLRVTYVTAGGILGLLLHHLLVEALDAGETK
jgi:hypothetical protein